MPESSPNPYLRDAVMTASAEQLQLMIYDGAIRFATQGKDAIIAGDFEACYEKLSRAQKLVLEMQQGLNHAIAPDLCERMSHLYMFIYRKLVDGCVQKDVSAIDDALKILNYQRETWVMLMNKIAAEKHAREVEASGQPPGSDGSALSVSG